MRVYYQLTLVDPVIISQTTATTNNHECVDYIPGSTMLGAAAGRLYSELTDTQSWDVFHNGACRFSPCYAMIDGQPSLPVPASWHVAKGVAATKDERIQADAVSNHAYAAFRRDERVQYKQWREGYITAQGREAEVVKSLRTKTAIKAETGNADDNRLFSYSYLEAGQHFVGWIDCPDEALCERLKACLKGELRLGRSRNSEFGRVKLTFLNNHGESYPIDAGSSLVLWCLSDVQMLNQLGMPTMTPSLQEIFSLLAASSNLPLPAGRLNLERSFIRSQRISRFNQTRQGLDSEQILISKGSVLVYDLDQALTDSQLALLSQQGIGINKQQGLGWVAVNPAWALMSHPGKIDASGTLFSTFSPLSSLDSGSTQPGTPLPQINTSLIHFLKDQLGRRNAKAEAKTKARKLLDDFVEAYRNARRYNNIARAYAAGPSPTQWGRIIDAVKNHGCEWQKIVFGDGNPVVSAKNDELGWGISWSEGNKLMTFAEFTKTKLGDESLNISSLNYFLEAIKSTDYSSYKGLTEHQPQKNKHTGDAS